MKILMIAPQPFFEPRGTPISVYQRLRAVAKLGHEVDLVVYHLGKDIDIPGVRVCRIPKISSIKEVKIGPSWVKLFLDMIVFLKCIWMMTIKRYDAVHTHEEAAYFSMFLTAIFRVPHLYDMHSSLATQIENSKFGNWPFLVKIFSLLERWVLKTSRAVITIGADLEKQARAINPKAEVILIENLPLNCFTEFSNRDLVQEISQKLEINGHHPIIYTGSFEPYQGLDMLIESAVIVKEKNRKALFIMVGGKPRQVERIKEMARHLHVDDCFRFLGTVSPQEAMAYLEIAEVLISPRVQGMSVPLKIYSYLNAGKPFVATRIEAHTQVLDDKNAVLVEPTKEAFAEGILHVLENPVLRNNLGVQAKLYAEERFNFADYTAKVDYIYRALNTSEDKSIDQKKTIKV
jgi:glycosyltransferase involved in cell wall biosynthesis